MVMRRIHLPMCSESSRDSAKSEPGTKSGWFANAVYSHPPIGDRRSSGPGAGRCFLDHSVRTAVTVERIQTNIASGSACACFAFLLSFSLRRLLCLVALVSSLPSARSSWKPVRWALGRDHSREVSILFPFRSDCILVFFWHSFLMFVARNLFI